MQIDLRAAFDSVNQDILTIRYTQREFKLKCSAILKAYDTKFTEHSKSMTLKNNFRL